jgi:putative ABC transport system permease protein
LALAMLVARQSVQDKITSVKSSIGNTVSIAPAGAQGFQGGGEPLTADSLAKVTQVSNVTKVTQTLSDRLTTETTNLVSSIDPGTLGKRAGGNSGVGFSQGPSNDTGGRPPQAGTSTGPQVTRTFTPPVIVTGTNDTTTASAYGGDKVTFTSGSAIDASKDEDKAVLGKALAEKNKLSVGSTFTAYGKPITVAGIYDTGNSFANNGVIMSISSLQRLSSQVGSVTAATATINNIDNLDSAVTSIKSALGSTADVTSNQDTAKQAIAPLESVKTISTFSLIGAVAAGAVIILLTMVMIVRERRREIGVYKAIGASNLKIMFQFMTEAVTLTVLGLAAGLIIGIAAASPVTNVLVKNSNSSTSQTTQGPVRLAGAGGPGRIFSTSSSALTSARDIQASVGWSILGYGAVTAFLIAIIGSAIPSLLISKVRPAEVMRAE